MPAEGKPNGNAPAPPTVSLLETVEPTEAPKPEPKPTKSIDEIAWEVIDGYWDYTETRWQMLEEAGYDAMAVQQRVNEILEAAASQ